MTPVRLEPAALRSRVKHSTTELLRSQMDDRLFLKDKCRFDSIQAQMHSKGNLATAFEE